MLEIFIFVLSIIAIIKGADWLGEASVDVAKRLGIPQLLIGATLVAVATTLPETIVAFFAGIANEPGISIGLVIGSPAANLGLIMGILFLFGHAKPERGYFTRTLNIFIFLLALILVMGYNGTITQFGGFVLLALAVIYIVLEFFIIKSEEKFTDQLVTRFEKLKGFFDHSDGYKDVLYFILGAIVLGVGAKFLVDSSIVIATNLSIPTIVIASTAIALGTSIPELATAIHAILKGRLKLSIGNLIGASILDLTMALGAGAIINTITIQRDILILSIVALFILAIFNLSTVLTKIATDKIGILIIVTFVIFVVSLVSIGFSL